MVVFQKNFFNENIYKSNTSFFCVTNAYIIPIIEKGFLYFCSATTCDGILVIGTHWSGME